MDWLESLEGPNAGDTWAKTVAWSSRNGSEIGAMLHEIKCACVKPAYSSKPDEDLKHLFKRQKDN